METHENIVVLVTCTDKQAREIANVLLKQRKAACVNIVPDVTSFFWWQGNADSDRESLLIIKSKASLLNEIITLVKKVHSYDVPEIIALPIIGGNTEYLEWIDKEVS